MFVSPYNIASGKLLVLLKEEMRKAQQTLVHKRSKLTILQKQQKQQAEIAGKETPKSMSPEETTLTQEIIELIERIITLTNDIETTPNKTIHLRCSTLHQKAHPVCTRLDQVTSKIITCLANMGKSGSLSASFTVPMIPGSINTSTPAAVIPKENKTFESFFIPYESEGTKVILELRVANFIGGKYSSSSPKSFEKFYKNHSTVFHTQGEQLFISLHLADTAPSVDDTVTIRSLTNWEDCIFILSKSDAFNELVQVHKCDIGRRKQKKTLFTGTQVSRMASDVLQHIASTQKSPLTVTQDFARLSKPSPCLLRLHKFPELGYYASPKRGQWVPFNKQHFMGREIDEHASVPLNEYPILALMVESLSSVKTSSVIQALSDLLTKTPKRKEFSKLRSHLDCILGYSKKLKNEPALLSKHPAVAYLLKKTELAPAYSDHLTTKNIPTLQALKHHISQYSTQTQLKEILLHLIQFNQVMMNSPIFMLPYHTVEKPKNGINPQLAIGIIASSLIQGIQPHMSHRPRHQTVKSSTGFDEIRIQSTIPDRTLVCRLNLSDGSLLPKTFAQAGQSNRRLAVVAAILYEEQRLSQLLYYTATGTFETKQAQALPSHPFISELITHVAKIVKEVNSYRLRQTSPLSSQTPSSPLSPTKRGLNSPNTRTDNLTKRRRPSDAVAGPATQTI